MQFVFVWFIQLIGAIQLSHMDLEWGVFRTQSNIYDEAFRKQTPL